MIGLVAISVSSIVYSAQIFPLSTVEPSVSGMLLTGNVEVVVRDGDGNVKAIRQGDNHIVLDGMSIIASQVFVGGGPDGAPGFDNNTNTTTSTEGGTVRFMLIGNGTAAPDFDDTSLIEPIRIVDVDCGSVDAEFERRTAREAATQGGPDAAQVNITARATFYGGVDGGSGSFDCAALQIHEAGIYQNSTVAGNGDMFARNTFGNVDLTSSDSLELTWRFTFTDS